MYLHLAIEELNCNTMFFTGMCLLVTIADRKLLLTIKHNIA